MEKASLVIQNKHLQQNLQDLKTSSTELKRQLTELSSESNQVRRKLDETERKANTEIATFKAILSKRKLEFGEDLDKLVRHIQGEFYAVE